MTETKTITLIKILTDIKSKNLTTPKWKTNINKIMHEMKTEKIRKSKRFRLKQRAKRMNKDKR